MHFDTLSAVLTKMQLRFRSRRDARLVNDMLSAAVIKMQRRFRSRRERAAAMSVVASEGEAKPRILRNFEKIEGGRIIIA